MSGVTLSRIEVGALETNCYVLSDDATRDAVIIDPGADPERIAGHIEGRGLRPVCIVITHGHADHIGADRQLKAKYGIPVYIHRLEARYLIDPLLNGSALFGVPSTQPEADILVEDGTDITAGSLTMKVLHTPGHTPGGITLVTPAGLVTGDTLFAGTVGRCDLPGGDEGVLMASLKKFSEFPPETEVHPGHGPSTTLAREFRSNPYLR